MSIDALSNETDISEVNPIYYNEITLTDGILTSWELFEKSIQMIWLEMR